MMSFFRLIMNAVTFSLIICACLFNCCAIVFLLLERRKRGMQTKNFQKNLEQIDYHLKRARRGSIARD